MSAVAIASLADQAHAIAALDAQAPLAERVVIVRDEPHAHALRVALVAHARHALAGTRFLTSLRAAQAVLDKLGVRYRPGEDQRRRIRLIGVLTAHRGPAAFDGARATSGWADAVAATIDELEAAALQPDELVALGDPRATELAAIWRALDDAAGDSWTVARIHREAHAHLVSDASAWPFRGAALAVASPWAIPVEARFVCAVPRLTLAVEAGRSDPRTVDRIRARFGGLVAAQRTELPRPGRAMMHLEHFRGIDEELEAAARWVADQIARHDAPLDRIAILLPPHYVDDTLVAERVRALPWPTELAPIYLAQGGRAVLTAAGARLRVVLRTVATHLPAEAVTALLPWLRRADRAGGLTCEQARTAVRDLGTAGGSPAHPDHARSWRQRLGRPDLEDRTRQVGPALDALVDLWSTVVAAPPLAIVWQAVRAFVARHLVAAHAVDEIADELDPVVDEISSDPATGRIAGPAAVALLLELLEALRTRTGRYGDPAIYVGSIASAAGLQLDAVRVLGLVEGGFPGTLRVDAVLPADLRARLPPHAMRDDAAFAAMQRDALDRVIHGAARGVWLSTARTTSDGNERAPAAVLDDLDDALDRLPDGAEPLTPGSWLDRVARDPSVLPSAWARTPLVDPRAIAARSARMHGELGPEDLTVIAPGLAAEYPASASALQLLLTCPQRFLLERMLGFHPRAPALDAHHLDPTAYGAILHAVAEALARTDDADLAQRLAIADDLACAAFEAWRTRLPLQDGGVTDAERRRLRRDAARLAEDDRRVASRRFAAAERSFGDPAAVRLETERGPLFVRGRIDQIDVEPTSTFVRDLKTGRARPRRGADAGPRVAIDLQLALYLAVVEQLAPGWGLPVPVVGAYRYVDRFEPDRERSFQADPQLVRDAAGRWLAAARGLLADHRHVRSPFLDDCRRCPFAAVCGEPRRPEDGPDATTRNLLRELRA